MEVECDHLGLDTQHRQVELEVGREGPPGELRVEVAEGRGEERLARA